MAVKLLIYTLFYISVFLLGFFGIAPIIVLNSIEQKAPYIILVVLAYPAIIGFMFLWSRGELYRIRDLIRGQESKQDRKIEEDETLENERDQEIEAYEEIQVEETYQEQEEIKETEESIEEIKEENGEKSLEG